MAGLPRRFANSDYYFKTSARQHRAPMMKDLKKKDRKGWFLDAFGHRYIPWTEFERKEWADLHRACLSGYDAKTHQVLWVVPDKKAVLDQKVPKKGTLISVPRKKLDEEGQLVWEAQCPFIYATPQCTYPHQRRTAYIVVKPLLLKTISE